MKNSSCVAGCLDAEVPGRATFQSIHRWPDSEAEFVRVIRSKEEKNPKIRREYVDGYSCRQMYLRSYTFSRKESMPQKTKKCIGKVKDKMSNMVSSSSKRKKNPSLLRKIRDKIMDSYRAAIAAIFHRLLSCTTSVDVSDQSLNHQS